MIRLFLFFLISLLWSNTSNAETNQICKWIVNEVYEDFLKEKTKDHLYVVVGNDGRCEYGRGKDKIDSLNDCEKQKKLKGITGKCKLFAIGKKRILENIKQVERLNNENRCIDGNCVNGEGTFVWEIGDKYVGNWKNGKPHGIGTFEWIDGTKYSGDWEFGLENGKGTVTWPNGDKYIGGRKNSQANGFGLFIYANGDKIAGEWKNGELIKEVIKKTAKISAKQKKPLGKVIWQKDFEDNNNQCEVLKRDPSKIYYRNLNWKSEAENIKKKRFVYNNQKNLNFRNIKDPSALKEIKFIKLTSGKKLEGFKGVPRIRNTNKIKSFPIKFDAYIYHVTYAHCEYHIEFRINKEFKRDKADKLVKKFSLMFGQLPYFLRHGYKITKTMTEHYRPHRITIHPGSAQSSFATIEKLDEPRDLDTYNLSKGEDSFGDLGHAFTLYPEGNPEIFYTLLHEAAHASIQQHLKNSKKWFQAVKDDKIYITEYARTDFAEDIAETIAFWVGIRCYEGRIKRKTKEKVLKRIPNRIKVLDELNLNTYPVVCKN